MIELLHNDDDIRIEYDRQKKKFVVTKKKNKDVKSNIDNVLKKCISIIT